MEARGWGRQKKETIKGQRRQRVLGDGTVLCPDCGGDDINLCVKIHRAVYKKVKFNIYIYIYMS